MHPDLSPHLHTDECNVLINILKQCHVQNKFLKYFGECNDADHVMRKCLRKELENNRSRNRARAEELNQRLAKAANEEH